MLYNPIRKAFTNREGILSESAIAADSRVLEVGAGNGFLTEAVAARARKVYAVELQEGMVRKLRKRIARFGDRIVIVQGDIATCDIGNEAVDVCLMYYSFHEVKDKAAAAGNISRFVRPGGILSIYEPTLEVGAIDMDETTGLFERAGFRKERERGGSFTRFARLRKHG